LSEDKMPTEKEIKTNHKEIHDTLTEDYYKNKLMSKEDFDYLHGQNWEDMEAKLIAEGHLTIPEPPRDLAEIDADLDKVSAEIMELLREVHS
ncbi:hypothetical protein LCGC14_2190800, partial [marine sediment metagenome]